MNKLSTSRKYGLHKKLLFSNLSTACNNKCILLDKNMT